jgi:ribosome-interacting GTPase 1
MRRFRADVPSSRSKSTLLGTVTDTESLAAAYEFTTLTCIPGVIHYKSAALRSEIASTRIAPNP